MRQVEGLRVEVLGDLPDDVMQRVALAVRIAVLGTLADLDTAPQLFEWPLGSPAGEPGDEVDDDGLINDGGLIGDGVGIPRMVPLGWYGKPEPPPEDIVLGRGVDPIV